MFIIRGVYVYVWFTFFSPEVKLIFNEMQKSYYVLKFEKCRHLSHPLRPKTIPSPRKFPPASSQSFLTLKPPLL